MTHYKPAKKNQALYSVPLRSHMALIVMQETYGRYDDVIEQNDDGVWTGRIEDGT